MMLECRQASYAYEPGRNVVDGVALTLDAGDFLMLLGPNGCGKSTLLKLLAGLLPPGAGQVLASGRPVSSLPHRERARMIAVVSQSQAPALDFTVRDMVMMGRHARLSRMSPPTSEDHRQVSEAMAMLDLAELSRRPCNRLSGGERQRVAIAAAVAQQAPVILLDEPTSALDPAHAISVMTLLRDLPNRPAVLLVCHDIQLAARYAKRVVLMKQGSVLADGSPEEVITPTILDSVYGCNAQILRDDHGALCIALRQK